MRMIWTETTMTMNLTMLSYCDSEMMTSTIHNNFTFSFTEKWIYLVLIGDVCQFDESRCWWLLYAGVEMSTLNQMIIIILNTGCCHTIWLEGTQNQNKKERERRTESNLMRYTLLKHHMKTKEDFHKKIKESSWLCASILWRIMDII